jgi:hypothetical protein
LSQSQTCSTAPSASFFTPLKTEIGAGYFPPFYKDQLQARLHPKRPKRRIFISRQKAKRRRLSNGLELEKGLAKRGFETYMVEDFSHQEQIDLLYNSEAVVGLMVRG